MYNKFKDHNLSALELEEQVSRLIKDDDVTSKQGIYEYVLTGNENLLNLRQFSDGQREAKYEEQGRTCAIWGKEFKIDDMEGAKIPENLRMLCKVCNQRKGAK